VYTFTKLHDRRIRVGVGPMEFKLMRAHSVNGLYTSTAVQIESPIISSIPGLI